MADLSSREELFECGKQKGPPGGTLGKASKGMADHWRRHSIPAIPANGSDKPQLAAPSLHPPMIRREVGTGT